VKGESSDAPIHTKGAAPHTELAAAGKKTLSMCPSRGRAKETTDERASLQPIPWREERKKKRKKESNRLFPASMGEKERRQIGEEPGEINIPHRPRKNESTNADYNLVNTGREREKKNAAKETELPEETQKRGKGKKSLQLSLPGGEKEKGREN